MSFLLTRVFSGFVSFTLVPNATPLLSFEIFISDRFSLYIIMLAVHGSFEAIIRIFKGKARLPWNNRMGGGNKYELLFIGRFTTRAH